MVSGWSGMPVIVCVQNVLNPVGGAAIPPTNSYAIVGMGILPPLAKTKQAHQVCIETTLSDI